ncbi:MAG: hypothetical protein LBU53_03490 [Zoogloeaceae bacterium]|jgi:hypothetical protein|nr:hypothetical protein [Zoogloeaceae bacterium]
MIASFAWMEEQDGNPDKGISGTFRHVVALAFSTNNPIKTHIAATKFI